MDTMKTTVIAVVILLTLFLGFRYFKERSLRRAEVYNSISELLSSENRWRQNGSLTNGNPGFTVYPFTNRVTVSGTNFQCVMAVKAERIESFGFMALAADGTVLWIDREMAPCISRSDTGRLSMPERFK